ncbi:MAG: acetyl/propionyl/methylcrotonyl-CoA carboxylase subunit alpha [Pseudomonadota bacterium]
MFSKILIANRGEIACRVIRTAREMGVRTVAVYSQADANALHVEMADEAVCIGPAPAAESYLCQGRIVEAALQTGAEAVHPGYGFLSENPEFVEAVEAAGLVFIGPPASAIRAMGLKDAAKALMVEAGVPVVPGYHGADQDPDLLAAEAEKIGYPILIKARAGGGGKGMRLVERPEDFADALEGAQREGQASFGDSACLIEKFVTQPRHIEIQIFGDSHGNAVHLFERDCSLQRRHQKVIEEAPAPGMPNAMRDAMGEAAVRAAKAIGYSGAGTVEFIVDSSDGLREDGFYFMEMNTRLQVEHPVTEAITGLDLVALQLRVATGEALPVTQEELQIEGHSFEARLYAEDPSRSFLPATGTLDHLRFPLEARVDSGVRQGDAISPHYDPMIAKLVTHGSTREAALGKMRRALAETEVLGLTTNLGFLAALTAHAGFAAGEVDTGLIGRDMEKLLPDIEVPPVVQAVAALRALGLLEDRADAGPFAKLGAWRLWGPAHAGITFDGVEQPLHVSVIQNGAQFEVSFDANRVSLTYLGADAFDVSGKRQSFRSVLSAHRVAVFANSGCFEFQVADPLLSVGSTEAGGDIIQAPMSGLIKKINAKPGDAVTMGQPLLVMEAMKMEHTLTAPRDGTVEEVAARDGAQVEEGALLVSLVA